VGAAHFFGESVNSKITTGVVKADLRRIDGDTLIMGSVERTNTDLFRRLGKTWGRCGKKGSSNSQIDGRS